MLADTVHVPGTLKASRAYSRLQLSCINVLPIAWKSGRAVTRNSGHAQRRRRFVESFLSLLPVLAFPVAMGLMLWVMMRGGNNSRAANGSRGNQGLAAPSASSQPGTLVDLNAQLRAIELEHAAIAAQLSQLESAGDATDGSKEVART